LELQTLSPGKPDAGSLLPDARIRRRHVLDLDDFTAGEVEYVLNTAARMKEILGRPIPRVAALRGRTVVNCFYEESTRTRISFELAAKALGADVVNMSAAGSSVAKGESLIDTVLTLQALGADFVVIRHPQSGAPYLVARHVRASVINAGDGWHAHPTQALLDLFTLKEHFGRVAGLKVVIVGDILHSRVARSNVWGLTKLGAEVVLCGPPTLLPRTLISAELWPPVTVEYDLDRALEGAHVVMPLRLQRERQQAGLLPSLREYIRLYQVNGNRLRRAHPDAVVMHPGPMNEGVEVSSDVAHGARSLVEKQVTNGVAVRMALLYLLSGAVVEG
jgi:aspartate carbamoyltransferase catalytic subunit